MRVQQDFRRAGAQGRQSGADPPIDATHLKAHRTAASLLKRALFPDRVGRTKRRPELQVARNLRRALAGPSSCC